MKTNETKKLYHSITDIDESFIQEAQTGEIRRSTGWGRWAGLAACLVIAAVSAVTVLHLRETGDTVTPYPDPNGVIEIDRDPQYDRTAPADLTHVMPDESDQPAVDPMEPPEQPAFNININWDGVAVNESEGPAEAAAPRYYDPEQYYIESWGQDKVVEFYGWNLAPAYIPENLTGGGRTVTAGIYREKSTGEIVQDQAGRGFWTAFGEDGVPVSDDELDVPTGFTIRASKTRILRCGLLPVDGAQTTDFGGVSVTIEHCSLRHVPYENDGDPDSYDVYTASFTLDGVQYEIEAQRLELDDVVKIAASVIDSPHREDFAVGN